MKPDIHVIHHFEYGDCLICKGIVIELLKTNNVFLHYKPGNEKFLNLLYKDTNIHLIPYIKNTRDYIKNKNHLIVGFENLNKSVSFDRSFYNTAKLDIELKWNNFDLIRDYEDEDQVYKNVVKKDHIFCHLKNRRGPIHYSFEKDILKNYQIIEPSIEQDGKTGIFSWLKVIQTAKKIIVSNSCFLNLIDILKINQEGMIFMKNTACKRVHDFEIPLLKSNWKII